MALLAALASEAVTVGTTTAVGLTIANLIGATEVEITVEGGPIRYLTTGGTPIAGGPGTLLYDGGSKPLSILQANRLRMIGDGNAATVRAVFLGPR